MEYENDNYIVIPKAKPKEEDNNKPIIVRNEEKNTCVNCGEKYKFTLRFGKGVNEVVVRLCRECMEEYKKKLDKEFGNTFWGSINKWIDSKKDKNVRLIKVTYGSNNN